VHAVEYAFGSIISAREQPAQVCCHVAYLQLYLCYLGQKLLVMCSVCRIDSFQDRSPVLQVGNPDFLPGRFHAYFPAATKLNINLAFDGVAVRLGIFTFKLL